MPSSDESVLVRSATAGNADALKRLLDGAFAPLVHRLERRIPRDLRSVCSAEDVAQDTMIEVCRGIRAFRPAGDGAFGRWVHAIALSRLRNAIRRHRAQKRGGLVGCSSRVSRDEAAAPPPLLHESVAGARYSANDDTAHDELLAELSDATNALPMLYREVVQLLHLDGRSVLEVAAKMGKSERAVLGLGRRARQMLRDRLGGGLRAHSAATR